MSIKNTRKTKAENDTKCILLQTTTEKIYERLQLQAMYAIVGG